MEEETDMPFLFVNMLCLYPFGKTSNRRATQINAEKLSSFVLSSHLDPIGEQNDVLLVSVFVSFGVCVCVYWCLLVSISVY